MSVEYMLKFCSYLTKIASKNRWFDLTKAHPSVGSFELINRILICNYVIVVALHIDLYMFVYI